MSTLQGTHPHSLSSSECAAARSMDINATSISVGKQRSFNSPTCANCEPHVSLVAEEKCSENSGSRRADNCGSQSQGVECRSSDTVGSASKCSSTAQVEFRRLVASVHLASQTNPDLTSAVNSQMSCSNAGLRTIKGRTHHDRAACPAKRILRFSHRVALQYDVQRDEMLHRLCTWRERTASMCLLFMEEILQRLQLKKHVEGDTHSLIEAGCNMVALFLNFAADNGVASFLDDYGFCVLVLSSTNKTVPSHCVGEDSIPNSLSEAAEDLSPLNSRGIMGVSSVDVFVNGSTPWSDELALSKEHQRILPALQLELLEFVIGTLCSLNTEVFLCGQLQASGCINSMASSLSGSRMSWLCFLSRLRAPSQEVGRQNIRCKAIKDSDGEVTQARVHWTSWTARNSHRRFECSGATQPDAGLLNTEFTLDPLDHLLEEDFGFSSIRSFTDCDWVAPDASLMYQSVLDVNERNNAASYSGPGFPMLGLSNLSIRDLLPKMEPVKLFASERSLGARCLVSSEERLVQQLERLEQQSRKSITLGQIVKFNELVIDFDSGRPWVSHLPYIFQESLGNGMQELQITHRNLLMQLVMEKVLASAEYEFDIRRELVDLQCLLVRAVEEGNAKREYEHLLEECRYPPKHIFRYSPRENDT
ncbi:hypothetical protein ERJ75_001188700 [Trypanosoma vivax]|uniref:Uncharacterized protein n=1 Tax=Trypanosoma vivax (strain Y486) TaxID=1055687 RepID=F9WKR1_TRYVY|nr:hypothetical protein TRVL_01174 [Trypanosoma vivax]KAH8609449.1 hypothetical protein ERJ75_001188700 [Trypanosoma vivax]CCD18084.1 hypothetical protein TvY486_0007270 [Trypanosoma vivax Y486]|eukprot:CCD18084.1 hypothetical protein TvY486_0007270 [Trypanosoma vivax Y486]